MRCHQLMLFSLLLLTCFNSKADYHSEVVEINKQRLHLTFWSDSDIGSNRHSSNSKLKSTVILLSGPTDNWNSDSAWYARLAPKLAKTHQVIIIDRAGQVLANPNAKVGYAQFGDDLNQLFEHLKLKNITIISFASANLALNQFFSVDTTTNVKSVIMIDPDVLLPNAIARYTKDALPFKQNLIKYSNYIDAGKYNQRALQKNQSELEQLKKLSNDDVDTDWNYVKEIFSKRLESENLKNLFREIAIYEEDLNNAFSKSFPKNIPLTIIDTNFEQHYIEQSKENKEIEDLRAWRQEASQYYKRLSTLSDKNQYIHLTTKEHLVPFSDPELLVKLINQ